MLRTASCLAFIAVTVAVCAVFQDHASAQDAATCSQLRSQIAQLDQSIANMRSAGSSGGSPSSSGQAGALVNQRNTLQRTYNSYCTGGSGSYSSPSTGGGDRTDAAISLLGTVLGVIGDNSAARRERDQRAAQEREMQEYLAREAARRAEEEARIAAERAAAEQRARERDARLRQATLNPFDGAGGGGANPFGAAAATQASPFGGEDLVRTRYTQIMDHYGQSNPGSCPSGQALTNYCSAPPIWWGSAAGGNYTQQNCINYVRASTMDHPYCRMAARRQLRDARSDIDEAVRRTRCAEGRAPPQNCDDDPANDVDWDE